MSVEAAGLFFDYSKNRVTDETLKLLLQLAEESGLRERIDAMFRGERINVTEQRAVLHVALRAAALSQSIVVDGKDVVPEVHAVLDKMARFCDKVRVARGNGMGTLADLSARSSTLASAAPIWDQSWPTKHCGTIASGIWSFASSRISTEPTSRRRLAISTRGNAVHCGFQDLYHLGNAH